jgi:hypothetical protein
MIKNLIISIVSFASYIYSFSDIDSIGILSKIQNIWEYKYSFGGLKGTTRYPSATYRLIVESGSSFKEYRNDTLINTDSFALQRNIQSGRTYYKIILTLKMMEGSTVPGSEGYYIKFPDDTTLVINDGYFDGYEYYFSSLKTAIKKKVRINNAPSNGLKNKSAIFTLSGKKIVCNEMRRPDGFYLEHHKQHRVYYLKLFAEELP